MEEAEKYLHDYHSATSSEARAAVLVEYQSFVKTLSPDDREQIRQFMHTALRPQIQQTIENLDALAEKANQLLNQKSYV